MEDADQWVERWLDVWARDMRDADLRLGLPQKAMVAQSGGFGGYRDVTEDWQAEVEHRAVDIINALMPSLHAIERAAVNHAKLRGRFPYKGSPTRYYLTARAKIGIRLRRADYS